MAKTWLEPIVQPPEAEHTATIIFLHGFNSRGSGRGLEMAEKLNLPWCKVILPQAPVYSLPGQDFQSWAALDPFSLGRHAVSVLPDQASLVGSVANRVFGGEIRVWEGMQELISGVAVVGPFKRLEGTREDRLANARYVRNLIESEVRRGIPRERIAVIGYSQGGCIAMSILFDLGIRVGAFVGLCTWFPTTLEPPKEQIKALEGLPTLFCHGTSDLIVPMTLGRKAHENCKNIGMQAKMTEYEGMGHDISDTVVRDVRRFLQECLPRVAPIRGEKIRKIHEIPERAPSKEAA